MKVWSNPLWMDKLYGHMRHFKKGTATSTLNNSQVLYRNICSTYAQILGDLSVWTPKLCFSEFRKHVVKHKSFNSPTSFFTIKVNFDKIQFEDYCIYRSIFFIIKIHIVYFKTVPGFFDTPLRWLSMSRKNENTGENDILYKIWNISKNEAPIGKRGYRFGEKPCMYHYQKEKMK